MCTIENSVSGVMKSYFVVTQVLIKSDLSASFYEQMLIGI